jgi:hypothetical protein
MRVDFMQDYRNPLRFAVTSTGIIFRDFAIIVFGLIPFALSAEDYPISGDATIRATAGGSEIVIETTAP